MRRGGLAKYSVLGIINPQLTRTPRYPGTTYTKMVATARRGSPWQVPHPRKKTKTQNQAEISAHQQEDRTARGHTRAEGGGCRTARPGYREGAARAPQEGCACVRARVRACAHVCTHTHACASVLACHCASVSACACALAYVHADVCTSARAFVCVCVCAHLCMRVHVCVHASVPCHAAPCRAVPRRAAPCCAVPCRAVPCRAVLCVYTCAQLVGHVASTSRAVRHDA